MKASKFLLYSTFLVSLVLLVSPVVAAPSARVQSPDREWVEEVFIDYSHAGPGPHPTTESNSFHLTQGGIRWFSGSTIEY